MTVMSEGLPLNSKKKEGVAKRRVFKLSVTQPPPRV